MGDIKVEELLSVSPCEEESGKERDSKYQFTFEVNTQSRGYLFCAETEKELEEWVNVFNKIICSDAADKLVSAS